MSYRPNRSNFSAETIRFFLLGRLQGVDQSIIEERLFADEQFEARVHLEELALADDYAGGRLPAGDRKLFQTRFLVTTDRLHALEVSMALRARMTSIAPARPTRTLNLLRRFDFSKPAWRYAFAALLLLLVFATVWRGIKEPRLVDSIIPKRIQPKTKPTVQQPEEANHPIVAPAPSHAGAEPTPPPHELNARTITVDANSTAEHPAIIQAFAVANAIRMQVVLPKNETGSCHAELLTIKGEAVFKADSPGAGDGANVTFDVPAGLLKAGDYQIKITWAHKEPNEGATYYIRVQ